MNRWRAALWVALLWVPLQLVHAETTASPAAGLRPFERESLQAIRDAHAGRPFVLALWSVYCEPCREEMVTLARFQAEHPGLAVVLVATDPPEEEVAVRRMLAEYAPGGAETWAFADAFVERLRYAVDPRWRGELPRTYLYDSEHRVDAISGRLEAERLSDWIDRAVSPQ